jgi:fatty acid desaturase
LGKQDFLPSQSTLFIVVVVVVVVVVAVVVVVVIIVVVAIVCLFVCLWQCRLQEIPIVELTKKLRRFRLVHRHDR